MLSLVRSPGPLGLGASENSFRACAGIMPLCRQSCIASSRGDKSLSLLEQRPSDVRKSHARKARMPFFRPKDVFEERDLSPRTLLRNIDALLDSDGIQNQAKD